MLLETVFSRAVTLFGFGQLSIAEAIWLARYRLRSRWCRDSEQAAVTLEDIPIFWINLADSTERAAQTSQEFTVMKIAHHERVVGTFNKNGAIGCGQSHIRILERFNSETPGLMVCEDDIEFLVSRTYLESVLSEFFANRSLDVLCLGYNSFGFESEVGENLLISRQIQTTSCYVVKAESVRKLHRSFSEAAKHLLHGGPEERWAIDQHWKKIQNGSLIFAIPKIRVVRQRSGYSEIQKGWVDYSV